MVATDYKQGHVYWSDLCGPMYYRGRELMKDKFELVFFKGHFRWGGYPPKDEIPMAEWTGHVQPIEAVYPEHERARLTLLISRFEVAGCA